MKTNFSETILEEVCIRITDGAHNSPSSVDHGLPMASVKDLTSYGINLDKCRQISEEDFATLVRQGCQPILGDVLVAKDGASALDTVCEIKRPVNVVLLSSVAILRPAATEITSSYLRYYMDCETTRQYLKGGFITGAAIPRVVLKDFKRCKVILPPLLIQRKIASILSAYDDLIENNTRRIAILEEMAQSLYREWFVHFRFPGHEKKRFVESELGLIPEGWEVVKVSDAVEIDPQTKVSKEGEKPFISMGNLSVDSMLIENVELRKGNSGSKFRNGDTLFARITPCLENGKTGFVQFLPSVSAVAFGSTEFIVLRSRTLCPEYVYLMARSYEFRDNAIKSMTGATGRQRVQTASFDKFLFAQPDPNILAAFEEVISPLFRNIFILAQKNTNLRQTRDLLLPKLISGEVDVEGLDIHVEGGTYESHSNKLPEISSGDEAVYYSDLPAHI